MSEFDPLPGANRADTGSYDVFRRRHGLAPPAMDLAVKAILMVVTGASSAPG